MMAIKYTREQFREWGKLGGRARAEKLSPDQRRKIASKAAKARELKRKLAGKA